MLFLGCLFKKEQEDEILKLSNVGLSNASNTFQWNIINGLEKNMGKPLDIINVLPVGTFPKAYKKLLLKSRNWCHNNSSNNQEIGSINIIGLKQYLRYKKVKSEINKRINMNENIDNILIYSTYLPFLKAIYKLDKKINITLIVTDLPEFYDLGSVGIIRKILRKLNNRKIYKYLIRVDKFVLLTDAMKFPLKVGQRPYVVVEGLIDSSNIHNNFKDINDEISSKKIILYTGTLHYKFGIKNLLDAFSKINFSNYELWICGSGEAEKEIRQLSMVDSRIKFFGYLPSSEIIKLQQKATILINPRQNNEEYTKYSFPSKTMEYLLSEKPVIAYKLDGIPDEYDDYLIYINGDKVENIKEKIIEICEKSDEERSCIGKKACNFIVEKKNNIMQTEKIMNMIKQVNDFR